VCGMCRAERNPSPLAHRQDRPPIRADSGRAAPCDGMIKTANLCQIPRSRLRERLGETRSVRCKLRENAVLGLGQENRCRRRLRYGGKWSWPVLDDGFRSAQPILLATRYSLPLPAPHPPPRRARPHVLRCRGLTPQDGDVSIRFDRRDKKVSAEAVA
jgi:hypothetical protein